MLLKSTYSILYIILHWRMEKFRAFMLVDYFTCEFKVILSFRDLQILFE